MPDSAPTATAWSTGKKTIDARVPVAAIGPQASNVMGVRDQTDLFYTLIGRGD